MSVAWAAYRVVAPVLGAVAPAARLLASPHERPLWDERMGRVRIAGGCHAWVHGASLGEANAVVPLVEALAALQPGLRACLTATTRAGRARLERAGRGAHLAPIDAPQAVARFFDGVRPQRVFIVETELWPHWLLRARREGVPVAIVSARLSERSVARYRALGRGLRRLVGGLAAVLCQSEEDVERWRAIGAPPARTEVAGNLKNDALPERVLPRPEARAALGLDAQRPLLVLGSLRPGEARALAEAWAALPAALRERWQVAALPRHVRADEELRAEARAAGVRLVAEGAPRGGAWRWDARIGVLNDWYAAADVAVVGGSLGRFGGHNPLEPAALGAAVIVGPHHASQRPGVRALEAHGAVAVAAAGAPLRAALERLLGDDAERAARAAAALAAVAGLRGAARRVAGRLATWGLWPL
uniref:3-deoxy-D-manno-octulosonic acid transferase n=1 Tax=Eiseniibacteriota bacterium TaxID=2212470 RepID=A0A832I995_UNCEI